MQVELKSEVSEFSGISKAMLSCILKATESRRKNTASPLSSQITIFKRYMSFVLSLFLPVADGARV